MEFLYLRKNRADDNAKAKNINYLLSSPDEGDIVVVNEKYMLEGHDQENNKNIKYRIICKLNNQSATLNNKTDGM